MTLTEFLLARIAHDERVYRGHQHGLRPEMAAFLLRECEAKRRIVGVHPGPMTLHDGHQHWAHELRYLAAVYADHPDYSEEWKL